MYGIVTKAHNKQQADYTLRIQAFGVAAALAPYRATRIPTQRLVDAARPLAN